MKKLALLIAILTIFTSTAFAQIDVTVEGSSEVTFGINLDDSAAGFKNDNTSKISFALADGSSEKGGESDVYGWIEIKEWSAKVSSGDDPQYNVLDAGDVTAKIMFNGGWVQISGTNNDINLAEPVFFTNSTTAGDTEDRGTPYKGVNPAKDGAGIVLGLDLAPATIEIGVSTPNDWTQDDAGDPATYYGWNDDDEDATTAPVWEVVADPVDAVDDLNDDYTFGAHLKATIDMTPLTVVLAGVTTINSTGDETYGAGIKVSADMAPLTIAVASDLILSNDPIDYEIVLDLGVNLGEGIDLAIGGSYSSIDNLDIDVDLDVAIDAIGLGLYALLLEVDNADLMRYIIEFDASYTTDTVKPYVTVGYGSISGQDSDNDNERTLEAVDTNAINAKVGCEAYLIENVTLKGEWSADPLGTATGEKKGNITFSAKISY
jgi:hypothetical protein